MGMTRDAAKEAGTLTLSVLLVLVFCWVWLPAAAAYLVVGFARLGWEWADELFDLMP